MTDNVNSIVSSPTFKDPNPTSDASRISEKGPTGPIDLERGPPHVMCHRSLSQIVDLTLDCRSLGM